MFKTTLDVTIKIPFS